MNGKQQPPPKTRTHRPILAAHHQTRFQQYVLRYAQLFHRLQKRASLGSKSQAQRMERFAGEAALRQILSGDFTVRHFPQTLGVPFAGNGRG